jgi:hypothetical protein
MAEHVERMMEIIDAYKISVKKRETKGPLEELFVDKINMELKQTWCKLLTDINGCRSRTNGGPS